MGPADGGVYRVFAATWTGTIAAAVLGDYPTPVVGYGGSAILGYALSLSAFRRRLGAARFSLGERSDGDEAGIEPLRRDSGLALSR